MAGRGGGGGGEVKMTLLQCFFQISQQRMKHFERRFGYGIKVF